MSPPAASFENPLVVRDGPVPVKSLGVKPVEGKTQTQTKTLAELEDKWDSFAFNPIRESQVSRAMSRSQ